MSLRTDLNGFRVKKSPRHYPIYLIDLGKKRHISDPDTYNLLFRDWKGILLEIDIDEIPTGVPITETVNFLISIQGTVYLTDGTPSNMVKRHIVNPATMDHYNFDWGKIDNIDNESAAVKAFYTSLPIGTPIKNPDFVTP